MATISLKTEVAGLEEREVTQEKRTGSFLFFFKTEWWEKVSEKSLANDIHIKTEREIRSVFVNGKEFISNSVN